MDNKFEYDEMVRVAKHAIETDQKNLVELSIKLAEVQKERDALARFVKVVRKNDYWTDWLELPEATRKEIET